MRKCMACLAALITAVPAWAGQIWTAACQNGNDAQYVQTINGAGRFSTPNGSGTYTSLAVNQSYYDGKVVCALTGVKNADKIGEVCADTDRGTITVLSVDQLDKHAKPQDAAVYCKAAITIH